MVTLLFVDPDFDLGVAVKALPIGDFLPKFMTLRTVCHAVQAFMDFRQFPRRYLGISTHRKHQKDDNVYKFPKGILDHIFHFQFFLFRTLKFQSSCFKMASPRFVLIMIPIFSRNWVGSSPPAKI